MCPNKAGTRRSRVRSNRVVRVGVAGPHPTSRVSSSSRDTLTMVEAWSLMA